LLKRRVNILSLVIFTLGVLISMYFVVMAAWAGLEAFGFANELGADKSLSGLSCPLILTSNETGTIKATVHNPLERQIHARIRASISEGVVSLARQEASLILLRPDESQQVEWTVHPEDAVYHRVVLVRVYQFRNYPVPSRSSTCGVLVYDIPWLKGAYLLILILLVGAGLMALGIFLWRRENTEPDRKIKSFSNAITFLGGVIALGMLASLAHAWLLTAAFVLVSVLMIAGTITYFLQDS
jgi:hypothetical protein